MAEEYRSNRPATALGSPTNALNYLIDSVIKNRVNTAIPVIVRGVEPGGTSGPAGYVNVMPLVCERGADDSALPPVTIFHLPYFRLQCGVAAVVADPVVGDIGLAVFAQQDSSNVTAGLTDYVTPGSYRCFDMADGFYFGGFLNRTPTTFVHLDPSGRNITITAPNTVTVNATDVVVNATTVSVDASTSVDITGPQIGISGTVSVTGTIACSGNITAGGISAMGHTHGGVETGSGNTGGPQ